ncbi:serine hydrolase [Undibacterium sp. Di26W]|uniref:serine hydrolase n=1 Tax=Undibacterium sp. Di26W TaxID=3413035 RepID=UPI003BF0D261
MRQQFWGALVLVVISMTASAQTLDLATSQADQVDAYLRDKMTKTRIPGMQVAVVKDGHIVLSRHYGTASIEFGVPVEDDTVFAINSITKAFTGVAAIRLAEEGKLDISKPVGSYVADLPEAWRGVTIRQLLSHMSGLPDVMGAPTVETDAKAAWTWVQTRPVRFAPGERFDYCQTNYTLVQQVVNLIEGRPLDAPLAAAQIKIADMAHTAYGDTYDVIPKRAPTYRWTSSSLSNSWTEAATLLRATSERFLPFRRASSGLNSTASDMARWIISLQSGEVLNKESLASLWTPVAFNNGENGQWGMGWQILDRGTHRAAGMTGGGRAAFFIYPDDDVAVVILTNLTGSFPEDFIDKVAAIYAPDLPLSGVAALRIALDQRGYHQAAKVAAELAAKDPGIKWPELELNDWGYRLMATNRRIEALAIFQLNVSKNPNSSNAEDSLAQAYLANEDTAAAITHYRRALVLDPNNTSAKKNLAKLLPEATTPHS